MTRLSTQLALCELRSSYGNEPQSDYLDDIHTKRPSSHRFATSHRATTARQRSESRLPRTRKPKRSLSSRYKNLLSSSRSTLEEKPFLSGNDWPTPKPSLYEQLPSEQHIRLLKLDANNGTKGLRATMEIHDINSPTRPQYTAISYTWGPPRADFEISISDPRRKVSIKLPIRRNLYKLLCSLGGEGRRLWIDALCISQDHRIEKNHQVRLMGRIYKEANKVEIWLASHSDGAKDEARVKTVFDGMRAAVRYDGHHGNLQSLRLSHSHDTATRAELYFNAAHPQRGDRWHQRFWKRFEAFCKRDYWTRRWIIQEVLLARTIVVRMGKELLDMQTILQFFQQVKGNPYDSQHSFCVPWQQQFGSHGLFSNPASSLLTHINERNSVPSTLRGLIPRYASSVCQEPCDSVYALYNLVGEHRHHLEVDYTASRQQQISGVLRFMQNHENVTPYAIPHWAYTLSASFTRAKDLESADSISSLGAVHDFFKIIFHDLGELTRQQESQTSINARACIKPLRSVRFICSDIVDLFDFNRFGRTPSEPTSPADLIFCRFEQHDLLALCDVYAPGDRVWQLSCTDLCLVTRPNGNGSYEAVGCARVFTLGEVPVYGQTAGSIVFDGILRASIRAPRHSRDVELWCLLQLVDLVQSSFDGKDPSQTDHSAVGGSGRDVSSMLSSTPGSSRSSLSTEPGVIED